MITWIAALLVGAHLHNAHPYEGVVLIGDSITWRWDTAEAFPGSDNEGIGGQECRQMWERFQRDVLDKHPKVVVIECGTNDIRYTDGERQFGYFGREYQMKMVEAAESAGARVIVATLPANTGWNLDLMTPAQGEALYGSWNVSVRQDAVSYGYTVADYYAATVLPDGKQDKSLFVADGTHPDAAGYEALGKVLRPLLDAALDSRQ